jgi:hypothetical protein
MGGLPVPAFIAGENYVLFCPPRFNFVTTLNKTPLNDIENKRPMLYWNTSTAKWMNYPNLPA